MTFIAPTLRKKIVSWSLVLAVGLSQSSCNLWSGLDKPSGDDQLLSAARGAFDRGDYTLALEYYQQLSNSKADVRLSEQLLVELAQAEFMSVSDLVSSLGSSRGGGNSIVNQANLLATRGKNSGANRTTIQSLYSRADSISNTQLRGYVQFLVAYAMIAQTLGSVAGGDGVLTKSDLAASANCNASGAPACGGDANCAEGSSLLRDSGDDTALSNMNSSAGWSDAPSMKKVTEAAAAANSDLGEMGVSTDGGIFQAVIELASTPIGENCIRRQLMNTIFPNN